MHTDVEMQQGQSSVNGAHEPSASLTQSNSTPKKITTCVQNDMRGVLCPLTKECAHKL